MSEPPDHDPVESTFTGPPDDNAPLPEPPAEHDRADDDQVHGAVDHGFDPGDDDDGDTGVDDAEALVPLGEVLNAIEAERHEAARATAMMDILVMPAVTNRFRPIGGVTIPISKFTTMMMPR